MARCSAWLWASAVSCSPSSRTSRGPRQAKRTLLVAAQDALHAPGDLLSEALGAAGEPAGDQQHHQDQDQDDRQHPQHQRIAELGDG
jgi:hypothetical protein